MRREYLVLALVFVLCVGKVYTISTIITSNNISEALKDEPSATTKAAAPWSLLRYNVKQQEEKINKTALETKSSGHANKTESEISFVPYDLEIVVDALSKLDLSSKCGRDALVIIEAIAKREKWALQMFDSSSKFPVGILYGAYYQMGNFDECVQVKNYVDDALPPIAIQGQYCLTDVELFHSKGRVARSSEKNFKKHRNSFNSTMHWGVCVPSTCTREEIEFVVRQMFVLATNYEGIVVKLEPNKCYVEKSLPFSTLEIIYGSCVGVFVVFIAVATFFHYFVLRSRRQSLVYNVEKIICDNQDSTLTQVILCFSLIKTVKKFLQTKPSPLNLECICGIKFLSMLFIIAGHSLIFLIGGPVLNTTFFDKESTSIANAIFLNGPLLVDSFLLISGFLMSYLLILELEKRQGKINIAVLYIARYVRLTPSYLLVIGLYCSFLYRMGSGPLWNSRIKAEQERCLQSYWSNLLYINNYLNSDKLCMFQSWYLAVDYHLFVIAPFVVYPLWRWQKWGKMLLSSLSVATIFVPFWITLKDRLDPTLMAYAPEIYDISENHYFQTAYIKTHMRANSYFLGLFFGFLLYKLQTQGIKIPNYAIWIGWPVAAICASLSMFSVVIFYSPDHEYNVLESAIYAGLHRVAWSIALGWVLIVCITENAAIVNRFLSWKPFIPLSRLTYCAYLVNGFIELYCFGSIRTSTAMSKFELTNRILSHAILTFAAAFVVCIMFESPIHGLEKILLRKAAGGRKFQNEVAQEANAETTRTVIIDR